MARRRRNKGTWFPILGTRWGSEGDQYHDAGFTFSTPVVPSDKSDGTVVDGPIALTKDQTPDADGEDFQGDNSLRDIVSGQDWLLQRLVGKWHVGCQLEGGPYNSAQSWRYVKVTAGFFVARAEDFDQSTVGLFASEVDPMAATNIMEPWIWRRTWMLANPTVARNGTGPTARLYGGDFPIANSDYGSVLDGPHLDSRVKRRITREHRLWAIISAIGWNGTQVSVSTTNNPIIQAHLDLRIYGSLRRGKNTSSF